MASLTAWITSSNTSDEAIEHIDQAAVVLADMHTQVTARRVLAEVLQLHRKTQTLLRSGKQRLQQTRELIRIDSDLLAQASVLLGDLGHEGAARSYGNTALLGMQEADTSQAKACYALAKTARWQHRYTEAADLARHGLEEGPVNPMSVQLAYYEANSAALAGDPSRARSALAVAVAETIADARTGEDTGTSPCPSRRNGPGRYSPYPSRCTPATLDGTLPRSAAAADHGWATKVPTFPVPGRRFGSARP